MSQPRSTSASLALLVLAACAAPRAGSTSRASPPPGARPPVLSPSHEQATRVPTSRSLPPPACTPPALPSPPEQHAPWNPPAGLPGGLASAAAVLFDQGLADPRGGEYRAVTLAIGDVWSGETHALETHAWVLPGANAARRYAVAWNGIVYPVEHVGAPADVADDVRAAVRADEQARAEQARRSPGFPFTRWRHAQPEARSASHDALLPLRAALLARLGHGTLAAQVWNAYAVGLSNDAQGAAQQRDPYLLLAVDWAWSLFDRAVCAHMRGAPRASSSAAETLARAAPAIEAEAVRRGFAPPSWGGGTPRHLMFLEQLDALRADASRRLGERACADDPPPPSADAGAVATTSRTDVRPGASVAELVRALDQVHARQWGQPGGVNLADDPVVQALIDAGDAAVEPLLEVLERDDRLTRSVHFHRDFGMSRTIMGVHEAAYVALAGILHASFFSAASTGDNLTARGLEGRRRVAEEVRAYWQRWRGTTLEQRWLDTLADERAAPQRWLEAASAIVTPTNVQVQPGSTVFTTTITTPLAPGETPHLRGEALRSRTGPSVAELLARRIDALLAQPVTSHPPEGLYAACGLARALAQWDARSGLGALARTSAAVVADLRGVGTNGQGGDINLARCLRDLALARAAQGDAAALPEFAGWIARTGPDELFGALPALLTPLWRNPDAPPVVQAVADMFDRPGARWGSGARVSMPWDVLHLAATPLIRVPAFRVFVVRGLGDTRLTARLRVQDARSYALELEGGASSGGSAAEGERLPPVGTQTRLRACDVLAVHAAARRGAPAFQPYWPQARRDAAIATLRAFVEREGAARTPLASEDEPEF